MGNLWCEVYAGAPNFKLPVENALTLRGLRSLETQGMNGNAFLRR
jgi:hypothetical protein